MHIRSLTSFAAIASLAVGLSGANAATMTYKESGVLLGAVTSGALPPVADRVPAEPSIADFTREGAKPGQAGGEIRVLMAKAKETRQMVVYGYARLVGFNDRLELVSDILKDYTVEEGRIFTLRLRKGHKWSDGHPFTTEDFRYWWEDIANNPELSPSGPPIKMLADGKPPKVTIVSETEIRFEWTVPNPTFIPALAQASPMYIYAPKHYLQQF
ncbi:MAG: ABC transporter substrate-binding protein, partial [Alphaproteobacteria bacterium]|nr:ABC transporter substrate-binding protein [Alphaproteobacteria bacterium]